MLAVLRLLDLTLWMITGWLAVNSEDSMVMQAQPCQAGGLQKELVAQYSGNAAAAPPRVLDQLAPKR